MTHFSNICGILGKLYQDHKEDNDFKDFIEFNDLGLPLAYFNSEGLAEISEDGKKYVLETWEIFLKALDIPDTGFEDVDHVFFTAEKKNK